MKTKTRTAVAIIAAILIINCVHISASGTEAVIESKEAHRGDIIDIEVCLKNNPGIVAAMFNLNYDTERLQLLSVQDKNLLSGGMFGNNIYDLPYALLWNSASEKNFDEDGVLVVLKFKVKPDAKQGNAFINLSYDSDDVYNVDLNNVPIEIKGGFITVTDNTTRRYETSPRSETLSVENNTVPKNADDTNAIIFTLNQKTVSVYGKMYEMDVFPVLKDDRVMLPIRYVAEILGARVEWKETAPNIGEVSIKKDSSLIKFIIGEKTGYKGNSTFNMDVCPYIENFRTYIPIRYVADALDVKIEWDEKTNRVIIF